MKEKFGKANIDIRNWIFVGEILIMLLVCIVHAFYSGHYANFAPINGTFQNFNPIRRLLDGQIPYAEFQDYLGLGHLYLGALFTSLFGGSYRVSLIAFSFLTYFSYALISMVIGMSVFKKKEIALAASNFVLTYRIIKEALYVGNSARYVRGMILPIVCLLLLLAYYCYKKISEKNSWMTKHKEILLYVGMGLIGGFAFAWSNDYGISCWVCMIVMAGWIALARERKFFRMLKNVAIELLASIIGLIVTVEIVTFGNLPNWLVATFGTGGYQSWYYITYGKSYYIYDIDRSKAILLQAAICIAYMLILFVKKASLNALYRYGIPAFCNMVCFCAVNEYKLLSGGEAREVALSTLTFTVLYEIVVCVLWLDKYTKYKVIEKVLILCTCGLAGAWLVANIPDEIEFYNGEKDGVYIEELGGNLTFLGEDILKTEEFLDGKKFFATYASAQEVVCDTYQPSGIDYIIHVLGDSQREKYLKMLQNEEFSYVATMKEAESDWECWIQRANWFFYRELLENWHPVYANSYEMYWEKNISSNENTYYDDVTIDVVKVDDITQKIVVQTDSFVNGMADVYVDYSINKINEGRGKFIFQTMLYVRNSGTTYTSDDFYDSNFLRSESKEYIPIQIVNGYGEATLGARPIIGTELAVNEVDCQRIFSCTFDYLEMKEIVEGNDGETIVKLKNSERNRTTLAGVTEVEIQNKKYYVDEISYDEKIISLHINSSVEYEENQNNMIHLIR